MRLIRGIAEAKTVMRTRDLGPSKLSYAWLDLFSCFGIHLERKGPGLYVMPGTVVDPLVLVARKYPRLTLGLTSALWVHGIGDRPEHDWWLLHRHARTPTWNADGRARYLRTSLLEDGCELVDVPGGSIRCHSPLRAIIDCVRYRALLGEAAVLAVLRTGLERAKFSVEELMQCAERSRAQVGLRGLLMALGGFCVRG